MDLLPSSRGRPYDYEAGQDTHSQEQQRQGSLPSVLGGHMPYIPRYTLEVKTYLCVPLIMELTSVDDPCDAALMVVRPGSICSVTRRLCPESGT